MVLNRKYILTTSLKNTIVQFCVPQVMATLNALCLVIQAECDAPFQDADVAGSPVM
jgi:hypothetical protein